MQNTFSLANHEQKKHEGNILPDANSALLVGQRSPFSFSRGLRRRSPSMWKMFFFCFCFYIDMRIKVFPNTKWYVGMIISSCHPGPW